MDRYTIKEIEALSGIKAHTIRIWEQRYNFLKPCRTCTNIRYYSCEELKKILSVALLNKHGYKISQIEKMCMDEIKEKVQQLDDDKAITQRIINDLVKKMVDLDAENFEKILDQHIAEKGMDSTVMQIIFPFLEKTGIMWQSCHLNSTQQYLVSPVIRQKLIVAIDSIVSNGTTNKSILLFLPESEHQELGILFIYYFLKRSGAQIIYLSANVPIPDVSYVVKTRKTDVVCTQIAAQSSHFELQKIINNLRQRIPGPQIIICGPVTAGFRKKLPNGIHLKTSLTEVVEYFSFL